jgi:hypothetical protein
MFHVMFSDHRLITAYFFLSTIDFWLNMLVVRKQNRQTITPDFTGLLTMKMKQSRSILAVAVVAASITASISPAQAFTWEELWGAVKTGVQKGFQDAAQSAAEQSNGSSQAAPESESSNSGSQQGNYTEQSSPAPQESTGQLEVKCIKSQGNDDYSIGEGNSNSMISVGQRAVKVYASAMIYANSSESIHGKTCQIESHPSDGKVSFSLAIPDVSDLYKVRVFTYVDGQQRSTIMMRPGQNRTLSFDVKGASSYAFQIQAVEGSGAVYYSY